LLELQFAANPPERIVRLVENVGRLAQTGLMIELASLNRGPNFIFSDDLNASVGQHG
jgi:hypothetical protein